MGWFKNKREERECYIEKRILDAISLSDEKLQKEIYLKKYDIEVINGEVKNANTQTLITSSIAIITMIISWATLYTTLFSNVIKLFELYDNTNELKDDLLNLFTGNLSLVKMVISGGAIFMLIIIGFLVFTNLLNTKNTQKVSLMQLELDILLDEQKKRKNKITEYNILNKDSNINVALKEVAVSEDSK